jgi:hypothetical protein
VRRPSAEDPQPGGADHYPLGGRGRWRHREVDTVAEQRRDAAAG